MAYRSQLSPPPEARAVAVASIKAAFVGAVLVTAVFVVFGFSSFVRPSDFLDFARAIPGFALIFMFAFIAGALATSICLMAIGLPIARLWSGDLDGKKGVAIALSGAILAFALLIVVSRELAGFALFYVLPAAYFYRREILLEESLR